MSELVAVHLYGPLADIYGARHAFAIRSPREAVAALDANFPGFRNDFLRHEIYGIYADGDWREGDEAATLPVSREIHLCPQIEGRGFIGPLIAPFIGAALEIGTTAASIISGILVTGLLVGLSFLLMPKPKKKEEDEEKTQSYAFAGPVNVTQQGAAVPLVYGRCYCGSVVASAGLEVNQILHGGGGYDYSGPDNMKSKQFAKFVDIISEGPIKGLVGASPHMGVFFDGVPLQNSTGAGGFNFQNSVVQYNYGYPNQPIMNGFASQMAEQTVGVKLLGGIPLVRTVHNLDVDRIVLTVSTPSLSAIDDEGDVHGTEVFYHVFVSGVLIGLFGINGKSTSRFQQNVMIILPRPGPWNISIVRATDDSTDERVQNELHWDSYTEIIDDRVNYAWSAAVGILIDAESFSSIPSRAFLVDGLLIGIPSNYDPYSATYSGVWDGQLKLDWSNNPAFVFLDLVRSNRYGLGRFMHTAWIDHWALYKVAQWCDERVPDGRGGVERRFTCNIQITDQQEAFDLLAQIASIFRGFSYWAGGQLIAVADQPADPATQFTNADVIDGAFTYSGSDIRARHTMAAVSWNDPALLGQGRIAVVEDQEAISRYGIQQLDMVAFGCTSEAQAIRTGKWALYTELYEGEAITFSTGLKGAYVQPGSIVRILDQSIAGKRFGGRVGAGSATTVVYFDAPLDAAPAPGTQSIGLYCEIGEGVIELREVAGLATDFSYAVVTPGFSQPPSPDTIFILHARTTLEPTLWRVTNVRQTDSGTYELTGVRHHPDKWAYVERNIALTTPDISDIRMRPGAVTDLRVKEYMVALSPISVGVRVVLSWASPEPSFDVYWRRGNDNWSYQRTEQHALDLPVTEGPYTFMVIPLNAIGIKGPPSTLAYTVIGRFAPPLAPKQFRIKVSDGVALFEWLPATEIDVIIGGHFELRHSSRTEDATWSTAQVVVPSIPGSASTVEAVYRTGTWFLRTFDIAGFQSNTVATIIALQPDGRYQEFARICENPDFLGNRFYTEVLEPQQWLVLGQTGGLWDSQEDDVDDWLDIDVLAGGPDPPHSGPRHGWYHFEERIDAGGIFNVRLSADILAFPYQEGSEFIDDRLIACDDWNDWDDLDQDLNGQVQISIRTTDQDPASAGVVWSEWEVFSPVEYRGRGFEFRADLYAPEGQNIGVEELCIVADLRMKMDSAEDVPYPAATTHVAFTVKFYTVPGVVITVQDALASDTIRVIDKTRDGFDINITNAGSPVTRVFDWQARGF